MNTNDTNGIKDINSNNIDINEYKSFVIKNIDEMKIEILKHILLEKNINLNTKDLGYNELKKHVKQHVDMGVFKEIEKEEEDALKEIQTFLEKLENSEPATAKKILNDFAKNVVKPTAKTAAIFGLSRILFDAMAFFMPSPVRTITGVAALGATAFKGIKGQIEKFKNEKAEQYNNVLHTLEKTDGNQKFSPIQIAKIKDFLTLKGVKFNTYEDMMIEIEKLNNKDKLSLINEINDAGKNKIDINAAVKKERKLQKAKKGKNNLLKLGLTGALGLVLGDLDKEVVDLVNPLVSKEEAEEIYKARTLYTDKHLPQKSLVPKGLLASSAIPLLTNTVNFIAKAFSKKKKNEEVFKKEGDNKFTDFQKIAFETLRNELLAIHPEDAETIKNINTLNEFKEYTSKMPKDDIKSITNSIVKLNNISKSKDVKEHIKEVGKLFGNSALLAGNSILAYQILLFLKNSLFLGLPSNEQPKPENGTPKPQEEPAYATSGEEVFSATKATEKNPYILHTPKREKNLDVRGVPVPQISESKTPLDNIAPGTVPSATEANRIVSDSQIPRTTNPAHIPDPAINEPLIDPFKGETITNNHEMENWSQLSNLSRVGILEILSALIARSKTHGLDMAR